MNFQSIIAYNLHWLDALQIREKTDYWFKKGFISDAQSKEIEEKYPVGFYSPNPFIRVGLAIFSFILVMAVAGLFMLFFSPDGRFASIIFSLIFGIGLLAILEKVFIQQKNHYRSGIDDCLIYVGLGALAFAISESLPYGTPDEIRFLFFLIFAFIATVRYVDLLLGLVSAALAVAITLMLINRLSGVYAPAILPFVGMICAALLYFMAINFGKKYDFRFWQTPLLFVEAAALLLFYASGNYWVIQNVGQDFYQMESVPLAPFFWFLTFLVPAAYIFLGLRRHDRLLLDIGFFCVVAAIASFRYYFNVMPLAWAATLAGAVLLVVSRLCIQFLKKENSSFTFEEDESKTAIQRMQGAFIDENFGQMPAAKSGSSGTNY